MELARQVLDAGGQIHRRPDACEFQAISTADISVRDLAHMKRQTEVQTVNAARVQAAGKPRDGLTRLASGEKCGLTDLPRIVAVGRDQENGEQAIAHELEDLAT